MPIDVDLGEWPVARVTYRGEISDDDLTAWQKSLGKALDRNARFAMLIDGRNAEVPNAKQRGFIANFYSVHRARLALYCVASAFVAGPGNRTRAEGAAQAIGWLSDPGFPRRSFTEVDEALAWIRSELEARPAK